MVTVEHLFDNHVFATKDGIVQESKKIERRKSFKNTNNEKVNEQMNVFGSIREHGYHKQLTSSQKVAALEAFLNIGSNMEDRRNKEAKI